MIKKIIEKVKNKKKTIKRKGYSRSLEKYLDKKEDETKEKQKIIKEEKRENKEVKEKKKETQEKNQNQETKEENKISIKKYFTADELRTNQQITWCPGCGNFGINLALRKALEEINTPKEQICIVNGIGCHGHSCNYINLYSFEGLHGRPIPVAEGIKIANNKLKVIVIAGDGDTYGEGLNHFLNGIRGNHDITVIVHDNRVYALTTGQTSPTSDKGYKSKSTPQGVLEMPINPMALAITAGGTFVARGYSGNIKHLTEIIKKAINHKGFSIVDVFQICVSFNKINTPEWYRERLYELEKTDYKPNDRMKALEKAFEFGEKIPIGVLYEEKTESYEDGINEIREKPLLEHPTEGIDMTEAFEELV